MDKNFYIQQRPKLFHKHVDNESIIVLHEYYKVLAEGELKNISLNDFIYKFNVLNMTMNTVEFINEALTFFDREFNLTLLFSKKNELIKVY